jgi:hypothetical protein
LDFLPPGLDFLPAGLDFLPTGLDFLPPSLEFLPSGLETVPCDLAGRLSPSDRLLSRQEEAGLGVTGWERPRPCGPAKRPRRTTPESPVAPLEPLSFAGLGSLPASASRSHGDAEWRSSERDPTSSKGTGECPQCVRPAVQPTRPCPTGPTPAKTQLPSPGRSSTDKGPETPPPPDPSRSPPCGVRSGRRRRSRRP